ncbi:MAG: hypothetical protein P8Y68_17650 [Anaerolineales bacterium]|jgi:hypothetical protein
MKENNQKGEKLIYQLGWISILLAVLIFRRNLGVELMQFNGFGLFDVPDAYPADPVDWFTLLRDSFFVGFALLEGFDLLNYLIVGLIFLGVYLVQNKFYPLLSKIALTTGWVGVLIFWFTNQAFPMLRLSRQYYSAAGEARQAALIEAGRSILEAVNPEGISQIIGWHVSLALVLIAGLIFSVLMLKNGVFTRWTGISGVLANGIGLLLFPLIPLGPGIYWIPPAFSAPFRIIWYVLIAIKFRQLAKQKDNNTEDQRNG